MAGQNIKILYLKNLGPNLIQTLKNSRSNCFIVRLPTGINWKQVLVDPLKLAPSNGKAVFYKNVTSKTVRLLEDSRKDKRRIQRLLYLISNYEEYQVPSSVEAERFIEEIIHNPPIGKTIPYYVGPLPKSDFDKLFPSGPELNDLQNTPIEGVNTLYGHLGARMSGTAFHCEDAATRSYNLNLLGIKIWIMINVADTEKFESLFLNDETPCDQFVRHQSLLISPAELRRKNIRFDIICAGPGILVVTAPRQYHAVINYTTSFAISTNFLFPGEAPIPPSLAVHVCRSGAFFHLTKSVH